jgi:hypothetical protein
MTAIITNKTSTIKTFTNAKFFVADERIISELEKINNLKDVYVNFSMGGTFPVSGKDYLETWKK